MIGRAITLEKESSKQKQRTDTKKDAKRIKINNFTRSKREKSKLLSQYWINEEFDSGLKIVV